MEIMPGVHQIHSTVGGRPLQLYLLVGSDRVALIDSGCAPDVEKVILPYLSEIGMRAIHVDLLINTHSDLDHCGGNCGMKQANPDILITCGESDRELIEDPQTMWECRYNRYAGQHALQYPDSGRQWIMEMLGDPTPVDFTWTGGETIRLGKDWRVEIHHTPGHSPGHIVVYDPQRRLVIGGDAVHGAVYLDEQGKPALCPTYIHIDTYMSTIRHLRWMGADTYCSAHWPDKHGSEIAAFLDETAQYVHTADQLVRAEIAAHPEGLTLQEIITALSPRLGDWPRAIDIDLMYSLAAHLDQLAAQGVIIPDPTTRPVCYRMA